MKSPSAPSRRGVSVRIFLADGSPDGLRIVEKSNWTGRAVMCSRAQYPSVSGRDEFGRPGVYVLTGPAEDGSGIAAYIGEADVVRTRLNSHVREKEFWTQVVVFSSKDENLNKAHVQHLEAKLVELAIKAKTVKILNGNAPQLPNLSEAERADAEAFLDDMLVIYPILGITAFVQAPVHEKGQTLLFLRGSDAEGRGFDTPEGFVVRAGAKARINSVPSYPKFFTEFREKLKAEGVFKEQDGHLVLTQDYSFTSPTTAAMTLMARTANGRIEWKDERGRTLKEIQEAMLPDPAKAPAET